MVDVTAGRPDPSGGADDLGTLPEGTVTLLFTDAVDSTPLTQRIGDAAAIRILRSLDDLVTEQIKRYRGRRVKGTGDGVMAAFQSARRAVECAVAIQRAVDRDSRRRRGSPIELRVGLNTGEVVHEQGDLFGSAVNVAQRIQAVAEPSTIFMSETTRVLVGSAPDIDVIDRGDHVLKGFPEPWHLYEVQWRHGAGQVDEGLSRFVGRSEELTRLVEAAERARHGAGSVAFVSGEPGIGKTRLIEELAATARQMGMVALIGHCSDTDTRQPYLPLVELLERASRQMVPATFREALGPNAPEIATLMPELRERYHDIGDPPELPPEQERRYLLSSVRQFLDRVAQDVPLLLVFEDLHWADEATLVLLERLAHWLPEMAVLIVGTYRDADLRPGHPLVATVQDLVRQRRATDIALPPLREPDVAEMLEAHAGSPPPASIRSLVFTQTDGNAFFVEALIRHLAGDGRLFDDKGAWRSAVDLQDAELPRGVLLLIGQRLERLSEHTRRALATAAVIGRTFSFDLLDAASDLDDDALMDAVEEAERAHLIRDASEPGRARHSFVHEQVRQALLVAISTPRRQRLHLRVAGALEDLYGTETDVRSAEIAHHLYTAGGAADPERTRRYLLGAARAALRALAYEDALWFVDAASSVGQLTSTTRGQLLELTAIAYRGMGRMEDALRAFSEAQAMAATDADRDRAARERAELLLGLYRAREALQEFEGLLRAARQRGDEHAELAALLGLGAAHYRMALNEPDHALASREVLEEAYALALRLGDRHGMAQARVRSCYIFQFIAGYEATAEAHADEALSLGEELGDESIQIDARYNRTLLRGSPYDRDELNDISARLEAKRDLIRLNEVNFLRMWSEYASAPEPCIEMCERGIRLADDLGAAPVMYPTIKALALVDLGELGRAERSLAEEVVGEPFGRVFQMYGRISLLLAACDHQGAAATARATIEAMAGLGRWIFVRLSKDLLAHALAQADAGWNGERVAELEGLAAEELSPVGRAEVALALGRPDEALAMVAGAAERSEAGGGLRHALVRAEVELRARRALDQHEDVVARADRWVSVAESARFRSLEWRLRAHAGLALAALGETARARAGLMSARAIIDAIARSTDDDALRHGLLADGFVASVRAGVS